MNKNIPVAALVLLFISFSIICSGVEIITPDDGQAGKITEKVSPAIIKSAEPGFPMKAKEDRVEGFVTVKFTVTKNGNVANPVVVESVPPGYFENVALNALRKHQFKPATDHGQPVDFDLEWPFIFKFSDTSFTEDKENGMQAFRYAGTARSLIGNSENQKAVEELSKAIELEPEFGTAYYYRSLAYLNMGEYEKAIPDITRAIELTSNVYSYYNHRGSIYLFTKDYEKAIDDFNKSLTIEPRNIVAFIDRGDAYRLSEKYEEAVTDYTSALDMNDSLTHIHNNRGYTYYKMKDNDNACKDFKKACDLGDCRAYDKLKDQHVCKE